MGETFDFSSFPVLTTERLRLRQLTHEDAGAMMAIFGSPEVLRFLNHPPTDTLEKAISLIDWLNGNYTNRMAVDWGITLHGDDQLIGMCGSYTNYV